MARTDTVPPEVVDAAKAAFTEAVKRLGVAPAPGVPARLPDSYRYRGWRVLDADEGEMTLQAPNRTDHVTVRFVVAHFEEWQY